MRETTPTYRSPWRRITFRYGPESEGQLKSKTILGIPEPLRYFQYYITTVRKASLETAIWVFVVSRQQPGVSQVCSYYASIVVHEYVRDGSYRSTPGRIEHFG